MMKNKQKLYFSDYYKNKNYVQNTIEHNRKDRVVKDKKDAVQM